MAERTTKRAGAKRGRGKAPVAEERAPESVRAATEELLRSLCRLGVAIVTSPVQLLPRETRRHLRAAYHESVRAGIALERGALRALERRLEEAEARLAERDAELETTGE